MASLVVSNRSPGPGGSVLRGRYLATQDIAEGAAWSRVLNVTDPAGTVTPLASLIGPDGVDVEIKAGAAALRVAIVPETVDMGAAPASNQLGILLDPGEVATRQLARGDALWIRT